MNTRSRCVFSEAPSTLETICDLWYQDKSIANIRVLRVIRDKLESQGDPKDFDILTRLDAILFSC